MRIRNLLRKTLRRTRGFLLIVLVGSLPLVIMPWATSYPYAKGIYALWMIWALVAIWAGEGACRGTWRLRWPLSLLWLVLLAVMGLSAVMGDRSSLIALLHGGTFVLLYGIVANTAVSWHQARTLLGVLLLSGAMVASYALLQAVGAAPRPPGVEGREASISTLGNVNYLASFLSFLFVPGLALTLGARRLELRAAGILALGMMLVTLGVARSLGAWLALAAALASFVLFSRALGKPRAKGKTSKQVIRASALLVAVLGGVVIVVGFTLWSSASIEGGDAITATVRSVKLRVWSWLTALAMVQDHPLLGIGLNRYPEEFLAYKAKLYQQGWDRRLGVDFYVSRSEQAHNEYLQTAAEMGLLGVFVLLWGLGRGLRVLRPSGFQHLRYAEARRLSAALLAGLVAVSIDALYDFPLHRPTSALAAVVFLGLLSSRSLQSPAWRTARPLRVKAPMSTVAALLVTAAAMALWLSAYRDLRADVLIESARRDLELGRLARAQAQLERSLQWAWQPAKALFYLGEVYYERGDYERAIDALERALKGLAHEGIYLRLAQAYGQLGDEARAWEYLEALLATEPHPVHKLPAYLLRAELWRREGNYALALAQLDHVIRQSPNFIDAYTLAAQIYEEKNDRRAAAEMYQRGLQVASRLLEEKRAELQRAQRSETLGVPVERWWQLLREIRVLEVQIERIRRALDALSVDFPVRQGTLHRVGS